MVSLNRPSDPAAEARNAVISIITAARAGEMVLAGTLTDEYVQTHGDMLPLFISCIALFESMLISVSEAMEITPDKLFSGICLGISVKAIEEQQRNQQEDDG